jgi:lipopolysaccharide export system protein LptA
VLLAVVGLGCAVAIAVYGRERKRATVDEPRPVLTDQRVTSEQNGVMNLRSNVNKNGEDLKIEAEHVTYYEDGRARYQRAHLTRTREDGSALEMWAGAVEGQGKAVTGDEPGLVHLSDGVRLKSSDGLEMQTDTATYDNVQGLATIPGHLTFTRETLSGDGLGATYDKERDVLSLLDQAHVARAPAADGTGAIDARAKEIGITRPDKLMTLGEHATIVQPDRTLAADQILVHFTDDDRGAKLIEMHGAARVTPSGAARTGSPDLSADDMSLEFHEDGQTLRHATLIGKARLVQVNEDGRQTISGSTIDLNTAADGHTLTNLEARGQVEVVLPATADEPDRTIRSATLVTSGDEKAGLKAALFDGGVTFVEKSAARAAARGAPAVAAVNRTGTSTSLALGLNGRLGAILTADFRKDVKFVDGNLQAAADEAVHDRVKGTLLLTPSSGSKSIPSVDDGTVHVDAMWIQVALETHDLQAKTGVKVRMQQGKSSSGAQTHTPALFDASQPVYGTSAGLQYVSASRAATFTGDTTAPAVVYQTDGNNRITASQRIEVQQETGNLSASGQVVSTFVLESNDAPAAGRTSGARASAPAKAAPAKTGPAAPAANTPAKPSATVARAQEMKYVDADRQAVYTGDASTLATLQGPDANVEAHEIVLSLEKDQRALKTLKATGSMFAIFDGGREAVGDQLLYDAATETHVITGKPMHFKNVQIDSKGKSCSLEKSTELHYDGKDQTITEPGSDMKALSPSVPLACEKPLKTVVK